MANESGIAHRNGAAPEVADKVRPYYTAVGREEAIFKAAYRQGLA
ncbi:MAG: nitric oxide reductase NorQ protein, partial [Mycobacterium sp.]|nr:nitric oxide reductase NorQ protein [Mycobacterium sp.]